MRGSHWAVLAVVGSLLTGCGGGIAGFQIDNVALSPTDIPLGVSSSSPLILTCDAIDQTHNVLQVWATSPAGHFWLNLGSDSSRVHWSGSMPLSALGGFSAGDYPVDLHAYDDGDRQVDLTDAVAFRIE